MKGIILIILLYGGEGIFLCFVFQHCEHSLISMVIFDPILERRLPSTSCKIAALSKI